MSPRFARLPNSATQAVLLSVSPMAGWRKRSQLLADVQSLLETAGFEARIVQDIDELTSQSRRLSEAGRLRAVVACGGDGTASLVRNQVPLEVPLVPLPLGTENLLAGYVSQRATPAAVCDTIRRGVTIDLDLGRVGPRCFLLMLSAGFDAEVIRRLHESRRGHISRAAYVMPTLQAIRSYAFPELQLYSDEQPQAAVASKCRWLFAYNLPLYARGLCVAREANGTDGLLDVAALERGSWLSVVRYSWHAAWKTHARLPDVSTVRRRAFRLESTDGSEVAYQIDGEFAGVLPIDVEVAPAELRMMVTRAAARRLGFVLPESQSEVSADGHA